MFSGSYPADDVTFLLKIIDMPPTEIREKERLIQRGTRHYSEMISREAPPSEAYLALFRQACARNNARFAADLLALAGHLATTLPAEMTLVSLARAGTPIGVLLTRILRQVFGRTAHHYSISIIRDRGIDTVALQHILEVDRRAPDGLVFVDGWTGKGVIARELTRAIDAVNAARGTQLSAALHVVADISGTAGVAATSDDYLIPSGILNAVISGLVSRTILHRDYIGPRDFHGCLYYREFAGLDLSRSFVDTVMQEVERLPAERTQGPFRMVSPAAREALRQRSQAFLASVQQAYGIRSLHHIKPGIGEATRVLLRRVPDRVLVRNVDAEDVAHLLQLADEKQVPVLQERALPYQAVALIQEKE